jgi:hypothetical protein
VPQYAPELSALEPAISVISGRVPGLPHDMLRFGESGTGVILQLDLRCPGLQPAVRERLWGALSTRANVHGVVLLCESANRSHVRNLTAAFEHLTKLLTYLVPEFVAQNGRKKL